ncbi:MULTISPECIES: FAD-dependent monooxygenase [Asticcacaulis]|uniref:FAD-dependent monooxygenase n=1 Tax=Asticcacaulis TaxID=76890 RepID=UPI001AE95668|nr:MULTISPECIES: FAD-dependent monooxygenase [Asticcacaulis]MBP2160312.1 2-polyprenyl-6-methoxyphenol hydroxylase-like FAD-dependent oxidoreductase [Asticcacaulis solisilvae]MDR6801385.1 2-polyprenyl-6-methoxyphenol hydroxylase-like FAD-dependent oxidoreductase [Asticcacaulis sp. BE141]
MSRRILITGASIAGTCAAWWLTRHGFDVTVVEKAPAFRDGGQNVDVRGAGHEVIRRMGLEAAVKARNTGERGSVWVDEDNEILARFDADELGDDGPTADLEILRGDLARLLYDGVAARAAFRFGDHVTAIRHIGDEASVTFKSGRTEAYDIVIVAEGVGSATRELVFPGENQPRWMDITMAYFSIPKGENDGELGRWYNATGGRGVLVRPGPDGMTHAFLTLQAHGEQDWSPAQQKAYMRERFEDAGWETPRILDGMMASEDFYFDVLRQVKMPRWSSGRVVLLGDAAWCATPLAGIGTTLALTGAYVLAGELSRSDSPARAFHAYDRLMRPFVEDGQGVPKFAPKLLNPRSRTGLAILRAVMRVLGLPGVREAASALLTGKTKDIVLPDYAGDEGVVSTRLSAT